MKLSYHPDTDSLYIDLSEQVSVESREVSEGVVLDYDADGRLVGMDIDNASMNAKIDHLILNRLPGTIEITAGDAPPPIPEHLEELRRRIAEASAAPDGGISWEEVRADLLKRLG